MGGKDMVVSYEVITMSFFYIIDTFQSSKKACFMQRDILHMNMNTHIIIHA